MTGLSNLLTGCLTDNLMINQRFFNRRSWYCWYLQFCKSGQLFCVAHILHENIWIYTHLHIFCLYDSVVYVFLFPESMLPSNLLDAKCKLAHMTNAASVYKLIISDKLWPNTHTQHIYVFFLFSFCQAAVCSVVFLFQPWVDGGAWGSATHILAPTVRMLKWKCPWARHWPLNRFQLSWQRIAWQQPTTGVCVWMGECKAIIKWFEYHTCKKKALRKCIYHADIYSL